MDIVFVVIWEQGIRGAAWATVLSQAGAGIGIGIYVCCKERSFFPKRKELTCNWKTLLQVMRHASAACVQQSVMNFGILMIQGLVNSFGASVMAAFAAAVKIDSFAYMPAQEFSNAFSLFIAQNYGSQKRKRMQEGIRKAGMLSILFCLLVSGIIFGLAPYLMQIFVDGTETEILAIGTQYLRIEGSFYVGIGILFLLYGYYRGVEKPELSLLLTILSLGTRVLLAYLLGIFLAEIDMRHNSLLPSIMVHVAVNVLATGSATLAEWNAMPEWGMLLLNLGYLAVLLLGLILFIFDRRKHHLPYNMHKQRMRTASIAWTSPWLLVICACHLSMMIYQIVQRTRYAG